MAERHASEQRSGTSAHSDDEEATEAAGSKESDCVFVLDSAGRVCGCGVAGETLFGGSQFRLIGRQIAELIVGLGGESGAPADYARQLARHCSGAQWQTFEAVDSDGRRFAVEIEFSRKITDGHEVFVLNLRRARAASTARMTP